MSQSRSASSPSRQKGRNHKIEQIQSLTDSVYLIRIEKRGLVFQPGQYLSLGIKGEKEAREYSIYSSPDDPFLEVLVREIEEGYLSKKLKKMSPGEELFLEGPFGYFTLNQRQKKKKLYFIATGSGLSPFHCYATALPSLDYQLIHGVRYAEENFGLGCFAPERVTRCLSRDNSGNFSGRVTHYLQREIIEGNLDTRALFLLCGNCNMIYEAFDLLKDAGVRHDQLFAEVYF